MLNHQYFVGHQMKAERDVHTVSLATIFLEKIPPNFLKPANKSN